jgi:ankyrin repeat protein
MIALDNNNNNGVAKFLMDHGANPHVWDVYGRTALYIVVDKKESAGGAVPGGGRGGPGAGPAGQGAGGARGGRGGGQAGAGGRGGGAAALAAGGGPAVSSMQIINALLAAGVDSNPQLSMRRPSNQGGRFSDPLLSTGTTPLLRAAMNNDVEVIRALLDKGANPNIVGMGTTPFLIAAGANSYGARGGGPANVSTEVLDLMIQHGADVNDQIKGTRTYSMRISRQLSQTEGMSALHAAVAANNLDVVRYLLDHGARTDLVDASNRTPFDVANGVPARPVPPEVGAAVPSVAIVQPGTPAAATGGRGGVGTRSASPEIRTLLQNAAQNQKK